MQKKMDDTTEILEEATRIVNNRTTIIDLTKELNDLSNRFTVALHATLQTR